jgi:DNA replication protein DnaC
MKYSDIYESITAQFGTTHTGQKTPAYLLLGKPGGGKSDLARAIGRDLKFDKVVEFNASLRDPVDLLGTPNRP